MRPKVPGPQIRRKPGKLKQALLGSVKRVIASQRARYRLMRKVAPVALRTWGEQSTRGMIRSAQRTGAVTDAYGKEAPLHKAFGVKQQMVGHGRGNPKTLEKGNYKRLRVARSIGASVRHEAKRLINNSKAPNAVKMIANLPRDVQLAYWRSGKRLLGGGRFRGKTQRVQESTRRVMNKEGRLRDYARVLMHPITAGRTRFGKRQRRV